jgi:hypothetical protein
LVIIKILKEKNLLPDTCPCHFTLPAAVYTGVVAAVGAAIAVAAIPAAVAGCQLHDAAAWLGEHRDRSRGDIIVPHPISLEKKRLYVTWEPHNFCSASAPSKNFEAAAPEPVLLQKSK